MPPLQPYQKSNFGGPTQVRGVDASSLLGTLQRFQEDANKRAVQSAVIKATEAGEMEGEAAFQQGRAISGGREDTEAGRAFLKASEAQWFARLEVDAQESSAELEQSWANGDYGNDFASWDKARDEKMAGLFQGADPRMAQRYAPRVESVFNRTKARVVGDYQARIKDQALADNNLARGLALNEALAQYRNGEAIQLPNGTITTEGAKTWAEHLEAAVEGRLLTAEQAEKELSDFRIKAEAYTDLGEFDAAENKEAFLEKYRQKVPPGLDPKTHDWVVSQMETEKNRLEKETRDAETMTVASLVVDSSRSEREMRNLLDDAAAERDLNPTQYNFVLGRINSEMRLRDAEVKANTDDIWSALGNGEPLNPEQEQFLAAHPDLTKKVEEYQALEQSGFDVFTQPEAYYELATMDPEEFMARNLIQDKTRMDPATWRSFANRQEQMKSAKAGSKGALETILSSEEQAVIRAQEAGILPKTPKKDWEPTDLQMHQRFLLELDRRVDAAGLRKSDPASRPEINKIIDQMVGEKVEFPATWFGLVSGETKWAGAVTPEDPPLVKDATGKKYDDEYVSNAIKVLNLNGLFVLSPAQIGEVIEKGREAGYAEFGGASTPTMNIPRRRQPSAR